MSEETFKLPGSSYEELCKIIQAYGKLSKPSSLDDVSQTVKINPSVISRNNAFLSSTGIIEGTKLKSSTIIGKRLARALDFENSNEISDVWREIVNANEFLLKMLAAIRIRKTMDSVTFQSHIAYSAGQSKNTNIMAGAKAIIEIFKIAELLTEKDGQLFPTDISIKSSEQTSFGQETSPLTKVHSEQDQTIIGISQLPKDLKNISVNIQIRLDVKPEELDGLGLKIRNLLDDIVKKTFDNDLTS